MGHKHISIEETMRRASLSVFDQTHVIFGGTGAVGGQTAIQMLHWYEELLRYHQPQDSQVPSVVVTGRTVEEITKFEEKLKKLFPNIKNLKKTSKKTSREELYAADWVTASGIHISLHEFQAGTTFETEGEVTLDSLTASIEAKQSPFEDFLREYRETYGLGDDFRYRSVISGIPLASVATYGGFKQLDQLCADNDITQEEDILRLKETLLRTMAKGFGTIKRVMAEEVMIAHTTAVGGMYDLDEHGVPQIRLGYAHSSADDLLRTKQHFATVLTEEYSRQDVKTLITAAAIGINDILEDAPLPTGLNGKIVRAGMLHPELWKEVYVQVMPHKVLTLGQESGDALDFKDMLNTNDHPKKTTGFTLNVPVAIVSGENGFFSQADAKSLYFVMKVASQEELAIPLARTALFGDDPQMPWFAEDGTCYYTETENAGLIFSLMGNSRITERARHPLSLQSYQALGSARHQAELHTLGMYMLLHSLQTLDKEELSAIVGRREAKATAAQGVGAKVNISARRMHQFLAEHTEQLHIEDIAMMDPKQTEKDFARLLEIKTRRDFCNFVGIDYNEMTARDYLGQAIWKLTKGVRMYIDSITSLGIPIIYRDGTEERILVGPHVAPFGDVVMTHGNILADHIAKQAQELNVDPKMLLEWYIANNGFVDLRAQATVSTARKAEADLEDHVHIYQPNTTGATTTTFRHAMTALDVPYFTSSGILAMVGRMQGLLHILQSEDLSLGSHAGWKAQFQKNGNGPEGKYLVDPGLLDAVRMYQEGLGKTTGTESLWPARGYFPRKRIHRNVSVELLS
ncbi:hypothetical protein J4410_00780 [Candidatus Woesearchaeota archaeon]|nr:hypothetical protein [Candidatus Woesearchaeota archaeon]